MDFVNFPIVALGAALICLIGVTIYAITQRGSIRSRDEQLVVARAQAYAMLELSQAGVLFLDREHRLMGEASAAAPLASFVARLLASPRVLRRWSRGRGRGEDPRRCRGEGGLVVREEPDG